jgi:hypothetical protein
MGGARSTQGKGKAKATVLNCVTSHEDVSMA